MCRCADVQVYRCADVQMCRCAGVCRCAGCSDVQMCRCAGVQMCRCADVQNSISSRHEDGPRTTARSTLRTPISADEVARAGCTDYAGDTPMHNNRAADFILSPMPTPTQPMARATRGTKRPPFDAGGYERFDSESDSESDSDDDEHTLMVFGELRPYKQTKLVC